MTKHIAYCIWHESINADNYEAHWNLPDYPHIRCTIRRSRESTRDADMYSAMGSFLSVSGTQQGYYIRKISLERTL